MKTSFEMSLNPCSQALGGQEGRIGAGGPGCVAERRQVAPGRRRGRHRGPGERPCSRLASGLRMGWDGVEEAGPLRSSALEEKPLLAHALPGSRPSLERRGWGRGVSSSSQAWGRGWLCRLLARLLRSKAPFLLLRGGWKSCALSFRSAFHFKMMPAEFNLMTAQRLPLPIRTSEFALFRLTPSQSDRYEAGK